MKKTNNGKSTGKPVNKGQKTNIKKVQQEAIFKEVEVNLSNTDYNKNKKERKKKKKKHKLLKKVLCLVLIAFLVFAGLFVNNWRKNGFTLGGLVATILGHNPDTLANLPRINILLIGQSQNLTDTILVAGYNPKTQDLYEKIKKYIVKD